MMPAPDARCAAALENPLRFIAACSDIMIFKELNGQKGYFRNVIYAFGLHLQIIDKLLVYEIILILKPE